MMGVSVSLIDSQAFYARTFSIGSYRKGLLDSIWKNLNDIVRLIMCVSVSELISMLCLKLFNSGTDWKKIMIIIIIMID